MSSPCGNSGSTEGISWPACQPDSFAIGATKPGEDLAHLDRYRNTDILVPAKYTSSSNAFIAGAAMILREAIEKSRYEWRSEGVTLPDAMMAIFQKTGAKVWDSQSAVTFKRLDVLSPVDYVFDKKDPAGF